MTHNTDKTECYFCIESNPHALEEHHLVPQRFNGSDEPENLVYLCGTCHDKIEALYDDTFYERLGIAVEEAKQESYIETGTGTSLDPQETMDRRIPYGSPHVEFESWLREVYISEIESSEVSKDIAEFIEVHRDAILTRYDRELEGATPQEEYYEDDMPEWVNDRGDEPVTFTYVHENNVRYPILTVSNPFKDRIDYERQMQDESTPDRFEPSNKFMESDTRSGKHQIESVSTDDYPEYYRIHCGYCHTAFGQQQHADAARHLRVRHGIEDPYEVTDTAFPSQSNDNRLSEILSDNDD